MNAGNAGPFTLDGTRTYLVGKRLVAVIDPGPEQPEHITALASSVAGAERVSIVLTHGHGDHAGAARALAEATGAPVLGPSGLETIDREIGSGVSVETDEGVLIAVGTPGHTADHLCYHWPERDALFAGDLLLGNGDTTWVAEYPGCVADYLGSLARVRAYDLDIIYPTHGPPLANPSDALDRFEAHRRSRIERVREALAAHPDADEEELLHAVYGETVPTEMRGAALKSLRALVEHARTVFD